MRIATYIKTAAVGFLSVANYRTEVWFQIIQRLLVLGGVILLWSVVGGESIGKSYSALIAYFLVANGARELVDAQYGKFASATIDNIKNGTLSSFLLQPTHTIPYLFFRFMGTRGVTMVFSLIFIIIGIVLVPPVSLLSVVLFLFSLGVSFVIILAQCAMVGSLAFWMTDAKGVKNVVNHVSRLLSGALIPFSFFPESYRWIVTLNPFAAYAHLPATLLQATVINGYLWMQLGVALLWALFLSKISYVVWRRGIKRYEAIGL